LERIAESIASPSNGSITRPAAILRASWDHADIEAVGLHQDASRSEVGFESAERALDVHIVAVIVPRSAIFSEGSSYFLARWRSG
jgi:hypothetical protein